MEINARDVNLIIETLRRNNYKSTDIHRILTTAWGDEVISVRQVQRISKEYEDGNRVDFKRKPDSGKKR